MQVEYYIKNVYGIDRIYIKDPKLAEAIARITGKKTIEENQIENFKELGIEFIEVVRPKQEV